MLPADGLSDLRILVVIPGRPEDHSMVFSRRQAAALAAMPKVSLATWFFTGRASLGGILRGCRALRKAIADHRAQVVHVHYGTITALLGVLCSPVPVVVTFHGSDLNRTPGDGLLRDFIGRLFSQLAALGASGIICVSEGLRDRLWWRRDRAQVIPMGVDLERCVPVPHHEARQQLGWPDRPWRILFNHRDAPVKRLDIARQVEARLQADGVDARLEVLRGEVSSERMPLVLSAADALLLCSDQEGSPTMVKEAMACGLPVVTNDVGDVRMRLAGVMPGAIVDREPARMAQALREVLLDGRRSNGRDRVVPNMADARTLDERTLEVLCHHARTHG